MNKPKQQPGFTENDKFLLLLLPSIILWIIGLFIISTAINFRSNDIYSLELILVNIFTGLGLIVIGSSIFNGVMVKKRKD